MDIVFDRVDSVKRSRAVYLKRFGQGKGLVVKQRRGAQVVHAVEGLELRQHRFETGP